VAGIAGVLLAVGAASGAARAWPDEPPRDSSVASLIAPVTSTDDGAPRLPTDTTTGATSAAIDVAAAVSASSGPATDDTRASGAPATTGTSSTPSSGVTWTLVALSGGAPRVVEVHDPADPVTFPGLAPGRYRVSARAADPVLTSTRVTCTPTAVFAVDHVSGAAVVDVTAGSVAQCGVTFAEQGRIEVVQDIRPRDFAGRLDVATSWGATLRLPDGGRRTSPLLPPGSYSVTPDPPPGWPTPAGSCDDGSDPRAVQLDAGETVRCTIRSTQPGRLVLVHRTDPEDGAAPLAVRTSWGGPVELSRQQPRQSDLLPAGTYRVTPRAAAGWDVDDGRCDDGSSPDALEVRPGSNVTCTFTSTQRGRIIAAVEADASTPPAVTLLPSWGDPLAVTTAEPQRSRPLPPGTYSMDDVAPAGWVRAAATCDDDSDPQSIEVAAGETVTCTFRYGQPRFTVASFNVLGHSHTERSGHSPGLASGPTRMRWSLDLLRALDVDVVGLQEVQRPQLATFEQATEWGLYPDARTPQRNKQNAVAWQLDTFELVRARSVPMPYFYGKATPMPLVTLRHRDTGLLVDVMTVHNPASGKRGDQSRWRDAAMRRQVALATNLAGGSVPFLLTGDMNERSRYFCAMTANGRMRAAAGGSNTGRCQPPPASLARIDWIFGSTDITFSDYQLLRDDQVRRITDHPVVIAEATLTPGR
jgi:endonuclease/exonuclease/phosphatase family metal-dependent hydrolase